MTSPMGVDAYGQLLNKVSVDVHLGDSPLPLMFYMRDWDSVRVFLGSADFRALADRVDFITLTNREPK